VNVFITIISHGGNGTGTGAAKLTEDVTQVLSQLSPIMQQLAGVDLDQLIRDVSKLPGALAERLADGPTTARPAGKREE
jgi:flotillin